MGTSEPRTRARGAVLLLRVTAVWAGLLAAGVTVLVLLQLGDLAPLRAAGAGLLVALLFVTARTSWRAAAARSPGVDGAPSRYDRRRAGPG